jgi:Restriction Enzyme Adenine Methylase Associated/GIY-YIG catalytic domain
MSQKRKRLLLQHLERLSWRVLDDYRDVVRDLIRRKSGIYALYRRDSLYYVGLASNLMMRLKQHLKDRHNGKWDTFSVYLTRHDDQMKELESLLLRISRPDGNNQGGKFSGSIDLRREFSRRMRERDADNRAMLLGGVAVKQRQRTKARQGKGTRSFKGVISRRMVLMGRKNGYEYRAALLKDGRISYDGEKYDTPSAAARAAVGRGIYGWGFWHYKVGREWVPLRNMRR